MEGDGLGPSGSGPFFSDPPYPLVHSGPCFVVGSAQCVEDDLRRARDIYGWAPIMAVNGASAIVRANFLYSQHWERFPGWIKRQKNFPEADFTVHSRPRGSQEPRFADYRWNVPPGGSSAWEARKVAASMGFSLVVLCGCPMVAGDYHGYKLGGFMWDPEVVERLFKSIEGDKVFHNGCVSMSGRTRALLG